MRPCLLIVLLGACVDLGDLESPPHPVDLPLEGGAVLDVSVRDTTLSISFTTQDEYELPCLRLLPSFAATLDGRPLVVERGAISDEGLDSPEYVCTLPAASITASGQLLHLADKTGTYDIDVAGASGARTMALSSTTVSHHQSVDITWSAAEDVANVKRVFAFIALANTSIPLETVTEGSLIHAAIPNNLVLPAAGPGSLHVIVTSSRPCAYDSCNVTVRHEAQQAVTVE